MITNDYEYVFDSVQFGIDVRAARKRSALTQREVGKAVGYTTAALITQIEMANYDQCLNMRDFIKVCALFDLLPQIYFDMQRRETPNLTGG